MALQIWRGAAWRSIVPSFFGHSFSYYSLFHYFRCRRNSTMSALTHWTKATQVPLERWKLCWVHRYGHYAGKHFIEQQNSNKQKQGKNWDFVFNLEHLFLLLDSDTITGHCHGVFISFSCGRSKYIPKVNFSCLVAFWTSMMMNCQVVHAKRTCRTLEVVCAQLHTMKISKKDQQTWSHIHIL